MPDETTFVRNFGTGKDVFLALSKLDDLLCSGGYGLAVEGLPLNDLSTVIEPCDLAFVPDFKLIPAAQLPSELFTTRVVGEILVGMCMAEGIILEDETHGYGVRLREALTPVLGNLVSQFDECLGGIALSYLLGSLPDFSVSGGLEA
jgi:hypothetical protein